MVYFCGYKRQFFNQYEEVLLIYTTTSLFIRLTLDMSWLPILVILLSTAVSESEYILLRINVFVFWG